MGGTISKCRCIPPTVMSVAMVCDNCGGQTEVANCKNPLHALTDGSIPVHEIGSSCMAELGDGEPSPDKCGYFYSATGKTCGKLRDDRVHYKYGNDVNNEWMHEFEESGAAQEVSPPSPRFPIINGPSIPWEVIEPHERQAQSNHDQTLRRLAKRGGLSPAEAWFVLNDMSWDVSTDWKKADEDGKALLNSINLRYERNGAGDTRELKAALEHATCCADPDCMACLEYHNKFIKGMHGEDSQP